MTSNGFKYFAFASIISAENDSLTEDVKQDIMSRVEISPADFRVHMMDILESGAR